ncbi:hypothetical protein [Bacillus velezensis]|nr:hypothetical protein [Bacillus velezensis]
MWKKKADKVGGEVERDEGVEEIMMSVKEYGLGGEVWMKIYEG